MKNLMLVLGVLLSLTALAQQKNEQGLYVEADGSLFSGILSTHKDGIKSEINVVQGKVSGSAKYYYASGKLMESGSFLDGEKNGKWTRYSEAGGISAIAFYKSGKKDGSWLVFDEKGTKRMEMFYSEGQKTGIWSEFDAGGKLVGTKDYSKVY